MKFNIIELDGICKKIKEKTILDNITFRVLNGSVFGLVGPNGAGKTTLIRILLGLYKPSAGHLKISISQSKKTRIKEGLGFLLHNIGLYGNLTCYENLAIYAQIYKIPKPKERIEYLLGTVGLLNSRNKKVHTLSRGMKQKLALIRGILHQPQLLILDEPTVGLDMEVKIWLREFIEQHVSDGGTVLISSHELSELEKMCTGLVVLRDGQMVGEYNEENLSKCSIEELYFKEGNLS